MIFNLSSTNACSGGFTESIEITFSPDSSIHSCISRRYNQVIALAGHKLFFISKWTFTGNFFKVLVKAGKIVKAAFEAHLLDAEVIFYQ